MKYVKFYCCVLLLAVWGFAGREANSSPSGDGAAPSAAENSQVKPNKGSASTPQPNDDRPTAQTADADPAAPVRKLTAKEVADLFADEIGTWKIKGHTLLLVPDPETGLPGKPVEFEDTMEIRWKEKGKSIEARFSGTIDGKKVPLVGHKEYDAQDGVFIWRSKGEGLPETVSRETYDPKNKIYRGQASYPDGAKATSTFEVINKNKGHLKAQVEVEGKVVFSRGWKGIMDSPSPSPRDRTQNKQPVF